jgi:hypothetical protein
VEVGVGMGGVFQVNNRGGGGVKQRMNVGR